MANEQPHLSFLASYTISVSHEHRLLVTLQSTTAGWLSFKALYFVAVMTVIKGKASKTLIPAVLFQTSKFCGLKMACQLENCRTGLKSGLKCTLFSVLTRLIATIHRSQFYRKF